MGREALYSGIYICTDISEETVSRSVYPFICRLMWGLGSKNSPPPSCEYRKSPNNRRPPPKNYFSIFFFFLFSLQQIVMGDISLFHSDSWTSCSCYCCLQPKTLSLLVTLRNSEINPTRCNNCVYSSPLRRINAIVASCWIYFTIKHDARNHKY